MAKKSPYKRLYNLFRPYFGFDTALKRKHMLWLGLLLTGAILQALLSALTTTYLNALIGAFVMEGITASIFFPILGQFVVMLLISATLSLGIYFCFNKLVFSLGDTLDKHLGSTWLSDNKTYYGYQMFLSQEEKKSWDLSSIIVTLPMDCSEKMVGLFHNFIHSGLLFIVAIVSLWIISVPLSMTILSTTISVPGFMLLGSIVYAIGFSVFVHYNSKKMREAYQKERNLNGELKNKVTHLEQNSENIAFKEGTQYEQRRFSKLFNGRAAMRWIRLGLEAKLNFIRELNSPFSLVVVSILTLPSIIAKRIPGSNFFGILNYFEHIVQFISWGQNNMEEINALDIRAKTIHQFLKKCTLWEQAFKKNHFTRLYSKSGSEFKVDNLSLETSEGTLIIRDVSLKFELNKITILSGPSGVGKSTLFRALAGILPFGKGTMVLPVEHYEKEVCVLSQQGYIPRDVSLLSVILYPNSIENIQSQQDRDAVIEKTSQLLKQFKLIHILDKLDEALDWNRILSGGEKQRLAYISAIMRNPKILLMDEPASALDDKNRRLVNKLLVENLPDTTMVIIDHHSVSESLLAYNPKPVIIQKIAIDDSVTRKFSLASCVPTHTNLPVYN